VTVTRSAAKPPEMRLQYPQPCNRLFAYAL
jgi:hypothetical protein